jgi:hypothetical protein
MLYRFNGSPGSPEILPWTTLEAPPNDAHWNFGFSLAVGEVTGGGKPDVVASAMSQTLDGVKGAGAVYVYDHTQAMTDIWTPRLLRAVALADESYGYRVAIGDIGMADAPDGYAGDGVPDVVATTGWGGPDTRLDITLGPVPGVSGTTPDTQLTLRPDSGLGAGWGTGEPSFADVNGDGAPDVFVGAMNAADGAACNSPGVAYAYLTSLDTGGNASLQRFRLAATQPDPDFAGYGRWIVGVDGTPLVLVTEQGRNFDATTEGQIYVYRAPQAPQP